MQATTPRPKITVTADGEGVVSHVGARLLGDVAAACGLDARLGEVAGRGRLRRSVHEPGRVLTDLAVSLADGGEAISDLAVLRDQGELFGPVASTATAWRTLHAVADRGADGLAGLHAARAAARERAWLACTELGRSVPPVTAGGRTWQGLVIDIDATLVICRSEKEQAAPTFKGGFGFHPVLAFLDNTGEALAGILRSGNAGANTAADHITSTDLALAQLPDHERHGQPILICADGAAATKVWLQHLRTLRTERNLDLDYSVGCTRPTPSSKRSSPCPSTPGPQRWRWTASFATAGTSPNSPVFCPPTGST